MIRLFRSPVMFSWISRRIWLIEWLEERKEDDDQGRSFFLPLKVDQCSRDEFHGLCQENDNDGVVIVGVSRCFRSGDQQSLVDEEPHVSNKDRETPSGGKKSFPIDLWANGGRHSLQRKTVRLSEMQSKRQSECCELSEWEGSNPRLQRDREAALIAVCVRKREETHNQRSLSRMKHAHIKEREWHRR